MRVFGIDPGSLVTGFGVVEEESNRLRALAWGVVQDWRGRIVRRFTVEIEGSVAGDRLTLDEVSCPVGDGPAWSTTILGPQ